MAGNNKAVLKDVYYAEAPTKFYRVAVVTEYEPSPDLGGWLAVRWYVVFNWGAGRVRGDSSWDVGQSQVSRFYSSDQATHAAVTKMNAKIRNGQYVAAEYGLSLPITASPALMRRIHDNFQTGVLFNRQNTPKVEISVLSSNGRIKPALAGRATWTPEVK